MLFQDSLENFQVFQPEHFLDLGFVLTGRKMEPLKNKCLLASEKETVSKRGPYFSLDFHNILIS